MNHPSIPLLFCAVISVLLPSCITQIPAKPGEAKLRGGPRDFNRPGPIITIEKVDGQKPQLDKEDYSTLMKPGNHLIELSTMANQNGQGELIMLLARAFAPPPPPPPQKLHQFTAESGHDYFIRWGLKSDKASEAIWIEDFNRGGKVVSGEKPSTAKPMTDPFVKK